MCLRILPRRLQNLVDTPPECIIQVGFACAVKLIGLLSGLLIQHDQTCNPINNTDQSTAYYALKRFSTSLLTLLFHLLIMIKILTHKSCMIFFIGSSLQYVQWTLSNYPVNKIRRRPFPRIRPPPPLTIPGRKASRSKDFQKEDSASVSQLNCHGFGNI